MLPKIERLKKNEDFSKVFRLKCSVATNNLITYVAPRNIDSTLEYPKVGFVVAKKVTKKATGRNKIKRRLREAYRAIKNKDLEAVKEFGSIIFIARPSIIDSNYNDIYKNIELCLKKALKQQKRKIC
ncbi:MAG: ribonuclease P protein component [Vampirovibrionia bacterium]